MGKRVIYQQRIAFLNIHIFFLKMQVKLKMIAVKPVLLELHK